MKVPAAAYPADWQQLHAGQYIGGSVRWRDSQIILLAALQADGHVRSDGYGYDFSFSKPRKIERLLSALEEEGIAHKLYPHGEQTRVYVADRDIPAWWRDKKHFGAWLLEMEKSAFAQNGRGSVLLGRLLDAQEQLLQQRQGERRLGSDFAGADG